MHSPASSSSTAVLRKAGIRLLRDARLSLARSSLPSTRRTPAFLLLIPSAFLILVFTSRLRPAADTTLRNAAPPYALRQRSPEGGLCRCEDAKHVRRALRALREADFVARIVFHGEEGKARVQTLFRGPPRAAERGIFVEGSALYACTASKGAGDGGGSTTILEQENSGLVSVNDAEDRIAEVDEHAVSVDDAGNGDSVDRSFLIGGRFGEGSISRGMNSSYIVPLPTCGVVWALRWSGLAQELRDAVVTNFGDSSEWWRDTVPWAPISVEWWAREEKTEEVAAPAKAAAWFLPVLPVHDAASDAVGAALGASSLATPLGHSVAVVAACQDRPETLPQAASSWIAVDGLSEIVLVDWSSTKPLRHALPKLVLKDHRLTIATASRQTTWTLTRAYNIAMRLASSAAILKVDCDTVLAPDFLTAHPLAPEVFYSGDWRVLGQSTESLSSVSYVSDEQVHVNGLLYVPRRDWLRVGGYDERVTTYGWDDSDIASRLARLSESRIFNYSLVRHAPHSDELRMTSQRRATLLPPESPLAAAVEIQRNRILLTRLGLPSWSAQSSRTRWNVAATAEGLLLTMANSIPCVLDLVSEEDALDVSKRAIRLILLRYGIPLLPKSLSLDFYKLLAAQVGSPERTADLLLHLHGGCASRILAVAASRVATLGSTPGALQAAANLATSGKVRGSVAVGEGDEPDNGDNDGSSETVAPPSPFSSWRLRLVWRQPDLPCSCRFNNVYEVPDVEVLSAAPELPKNLTLELDVSGTEDESGSSSSNTSDVRSLLESVIPLPGKRIFIAALTGDVRPGVASASHTKAVRAFLQTLLPTKLTHDRILHSLRSKHPSDLDDAELLPEALPALLGETAAANLLASFAKPDIHAMVATWGTTPRAQIHTEYHLDRRAIALTAAVIAREGRSDVNAGSGSDGEMHVERNPDVKSIALRVLSMFEGSPGAPEEYLQAYPELAVLLAASLSGNICTAGIDVSRRGKQH